MPRHEGRILITGFGIVAQALMPLLLRHLGVPCSRITVIEFARAPALAPWRKKGVRLVRERVTPANLPYLGRLISTPVGWTPLDNFHLHFGERPRSQPDRRDPWQYRNFAFQP
jgi:homospermidine synthase